MEGYSSQNNNQTIKDIPYVGIRINKTGLIEKIRTKQMKELIIIIIMIIIISFEWSFYIENCARRATSHVAC